MLNIIYSCISDHIFFYQHEFQVNKENYKVDSYSYMSVIYNDLGPFRRIAFCRNSILSKPILPNLI